MVVVSKDRNQSQRPRVQCVCVLQSLKCVYIIQTDHDVMIRHDGLRGTFYIKRINADFNDA